MNYISVRLVPRACFSCCFRTILQPGTIVFCVCRSARVKVSMYHCGEKMHTSCIRHKDVHYMHVKCMQAREFTIVEVRGAFNGGTEASARCRTVTYSTRSARATTARAALKRLLPRLVLHASRSSLSSPRPSMRAVLPFCREISAPTSTRHRPDPEPVFHLPDEERAFSAHPSHDGRAARVRGAQAGWVCGAARRAAGRPGRW